MKVTRRFPFTLAAPSSDGVKRKWEINGLNLGEAGTAKIHGLENPSWERGNISHQTGSSENH